MLGDTAGTDWLPLPLLLPLPLPLPLPVVAEADSDEDADDDDDCCGLFRHSGLNSGFQKAYFTTQEKKQKQKRISG